MTSNSRKIDDMTPVAEAGDLTVIDAIIHAVRNCVAQMTAGGGASRGGAVGPQASQIMVLLYILMSARNFIGVLEKQRVRNFLAELPELFLLSDKKTVPDDLKKVFKAFDLAWPLPEEKNSTTTARRKGVLVTVVGIVPSRRLPLEKMINKAFSPKRRKPDGKSLAQR